MLIEFQVPRDGGENDHYCGNINHGCIKAKLVLNIDHPKPYKMECDLLCILEVGQCNLWCAITMLIKLVVNSFSFSVNYAGFGNASFGGQFFTLY